MLGALIDYLMTRAAIWDAQVALQWLTGSLNWVSDATMRILLVLMLVIVSPTLCRGRPRGPTAAPTCSPT